MRVYETIKAWRGEAVLGALWVVKVLSKPLGMHKIYRSLIIHLIKRRGIFDPVYYLEFNTDVTQTEMSPLCHYASFGDREGRTPMVFFDPVYYRSHVRGRTKRVNALLHYAYIGRYRRISPSPWFDVDYYLSHNKDVARAGIDPLLHYLKWGGLEGRSPCPQFDGSYYLRSYPDVVAARINPLIHYLFFGRIKGLRTLPEHRDATSPDAQTGGAYHPVIPGHEAWSLLRPRGEVRAAEVDVVVPVYNARIETLRCLYSVLSALCDTPFSLIVINDASPDLDLVEDLQRLAHLGLFTLLSNSENYGFVHTVNRGMLLHNQRDVVLLNSDTEVYDGWLDRLRGAACRNEYTGTVTPLSNNATICSYPRFLHDNPFPLELDYAELDALAADVNADVEVVDAPTGVGFCMYIKRACLDAVGLFDELTFGKGYGEENDFCQKAIQKGWRNVIATDLFVRHWGATSFQGERAKRVESALKIIDKRYPLYRKDVNEFIKRDPLHEARRRLDLARIRRMRREKNILIVCHNRGGGAERHVQEDIQRLSQEGYGVFVLRPMARKSTHAILSHSVITSLPNIPAFALAEIEVLTETLKQLGITEVHVHSLVDLAPEASSHVIKIVNALGAQLEVNLHDYEVICPRINLADEDGRYCGEPDETACNRCLLERSSSFHVSDIGVWRSVHGQLLSVANRVLVPDQDVSDRLFGYFPEVSFEVSPHENIASEAIQVQMPVLQTDEKLRVVIIGAIGKLKGFHVIISCANNARQYNLPIEFTVMGYSMNDRLMDVAGVYVTGKYQEHEALAKLNSLKPHVVWLPSLWPETYSYTLSIALKAQYPVFAFDIGAIARRIKEAGMGEMLMPLSIFDSPSSINHQFEKFREGCLQPLL